MTVASPAEGAGDVDQHIGWNVHALLHRRHLNQKQLALALGVTPSVLSKKLRGESAWSARQVAATAAFLDIEPGRLFQPSPSRVGTLLELHQGGARKSGVSDSPLLFPVPSN